MCPQIEAACRPFDKAMMREALGLAWRAAGRTSPNPLVGAVVVKGAEVVGRGYHRRAGGPHAEVVALEEAGPRAKGGALYVTLEPCVHYGKTPPCVERILASGLQKVVVGALDPDERVVGRGVERLIAEGIDVRVGLLGEEAMLANLAYFKRKALGGVTITLKAAVSLDGRISPAPGTRGGLSGREAKLAGQRLRAQHAGVMVGLETLLVDDPKLDTRYLPEAEPPLPVILDGRLRFPLDHHWLAQSRPFIVVTGEGAPSAKIQEIEARGAKVVRCRWVETRIDLEEALTKLAGEGVDSLLVEGGARVLTSFLEAGLWDAFYLFLASKLFGCGGVDLFGGDGPKELPGRPVTAVALAEDIVVAYLSETTRRKLRGYLG